MCVCVCVFVCVRNPLPFLSRLNGLNATELLARIAAHSDEQKKILNLSHDWLQSFLPHCIAKINRVSLVCCRRLTSRQESARTCPSHGTCS